MVQLTPIATGRRTRYKVPLIVLAGLLGLLYLWHQTPAEAQVPNVSDKLQMSHEAVGLGAEVVPNLSAGFQSEGNKASTDVANVDKLVQTGEIPDHKTAVIGDEADSEADAPATQSSQAEESDTTTSVVKADHAKSETLITDSQEKSNPQEKSPEKIEQVLGQTKVEKEGKKVGDEKKQEEEKVEKDDQSTNASAQAAQKETEEKTPELTPEQQKEKDEQERKKQQKEREDQVRERRRKLDALRKVQKEEVLARLGQPNETEYREKLSVSDNEIGVIVRTGYDVQHRLEGPLSTFLLGKDDHVFLASDIESTYEGRQLHDSIGRLGSRQHIRESEKYKLYEKLKTRAGEVKKADGNYDYNHKETEGWKLDGLKFVSSIEIGYEALGGDYKWYLILDDDTYVHYPSLKSILSKLDYTQKHFLGMGGWVMGGLPYAHGGAGIVVSQAAMASRFVEHAESLGKIHDRSVSTGFGDFLFSIAMDEIDITVDNTYRISFHEHEPARERIGRDDTCKPAITYHHLAVSVMQQIDSKFRETSFGHLDLKDFLEQDSFLYRRDGWSYNLERDDNKEDPKVRADLTRINMDERHKDWMNADRCAHMCTGMSDKCVAWTYIDEGEKSCVLSDFFRMGYARSGMVSGVNRKVLDEWIKDCRGYPEP